MTKLLKHPLRTKKAYSSEIIQPNGIQKLRTFPNNQYCHIYKSCVLSDPFTPRKSVYLQGSQVCTLNSVKLFHVTLTPVSFSCLSSISLGQTLLAIGLVLQTFN